MGWEDDIVSKMQASKRENLSLISEPMLEKKYYKGGGRIWKDWEMWGIGVHDVKFTKSQEKMMWGKYLVRGGSAPAVPC